MRILCTGTTGFLGGHLYQHLIERGHDVVPVIRSKEKYGLVDNAIYITKLNSKTNWEQMLDDFDVVIHCAARAHVMKDESSNPLREYRETNTCGTINLANAAIKSGVKRFIFISSVKVNGETTSGREPFSPDEARNAIDNYGISKAEAELALMELSNETEMDIVVLRPPLIYGPGVKANFAALMRLSRKGVPVPFGCLNKNKRSLISIYNLLDVLTVCLEHPNASNQVFLVSDGEDVSTKDLYQMLCRAHGKSCFIIPIPLFVFRLLGRVFNKKDMIERLVGSLQVDISKSQRLLGWYPKTSLQEGINMLVKK